MRLGALGSCFGVTMAAAFLSLAPGSAMAEEPCRQVYSESGAEIEKDPGMSDIMVFPPCDDGLPPPPPPPPPPTVTLDSAFDQAMYGFEVRFGDFDTNGRDDVYIKRLDGNPDNGVVYEAVALQSPLGQYWLAPAGSATMQTARTYPIASNVTVNVTDLDSNGYFDPTVAYFPPGVNALYPVTFVSSGQPFVRAPIAAIAYDESIQRFDEDLFNARQDASYFDDAKEPDTYGFDVSLTLEVQRCEFFFGIPFCVTVTLRTEDLGFISLEELGIQTSASDPSQTPSRVDLIPQVQPSVVGQFNSVALPVMAEPQLPTYIDTPSDANQAKAHFGLADGGANGPVSCIALCGTYFYYDFIEDVMYTYFWYDTWRPATIEGAFDHANFSKDAFDAFEAEQQLAEILAGPANSLTRPVADQRIRDYNDYLKRGWGWPVPDPSPAEQIVDILDQAGEDIADGVGALWRRYKIWRVRKAIESECATAEDHEDCIAAFEDYVFSEIAEDGTVAGVWDPNELEEWQNNNEFRKRLPVLIVASALVTGPGRWQCSYTKWNERSELPYSNWRYYGITSIRADRGDCYDAVQKRSERHDKSLRFQAFGPWEDSDLDVALPPTALNLPVLVARRGVIRGREQQLIDSVLFSIPGNNWSHGLDARPMVFNLIRSVARSNPIGCELWIASNAAFRNYPFRESPVGPYTGDPDPLCN